MEHDDPVHLHLHQLLRPRQRHILRDKQKGPLYFEFFESPFTLVSTVSGPAYPRHKKAPNLIEKTSHLRLRGQDFGEVVVAGNGTRIGKGTGGWSKTGCKSSRKAHSWNTRVLRRSLKWPHEIFESGFFTQIRPVRLDDLGTGEKIWHFASWSLYLKVFATNILFSVCSACA
jgi:hypothetical protein